METTVALARLPETHQQALVLLEQDLSKIIQSDVARQRLVGVMAVQIQNDAVLMKCTPKSICAGIVRMVQLGLDPSIPNSAWLIPRQINGEWQATYQTGYAGKRQLVLNHPEVLDVYAEKVCKGEEFVWNGPHEKPMHVNFGDDIWADRGEVLGFYAVAILRDKSGAERYRALKISAKDVREHAKKYSQAAQKGAWIKNFDEMGIVTALRLLCTPKYLPMSTEAIAQFQEEAADLGLRQGDPLVDGMRVVGNERLVTQDRAETIRRANEAIETLFGEHGDLQGVEDVQPTTESLWMQYDLICEDRGYDPAKPLVSLAKQYPQCQDVRAQLSQEEVQKFLTWLVKPTEREKQDTWYRRKPGAQQSQTQERAAEVQQTQEAQEEGARPSRLREASSTLKAQIDALDAHEQNGSLDQEGREARSVLYMHLDAMEEGDVPEAWLEAHDEAEAWLTAHAAEIAQESLL